MPHLVCSRIRSRSPGVCASTSPNTASDFAAAVDVGVVEQRDAGRQRGLDGGGGLVHVRGRVRRLGPAAAQAHAAVDQFLGRQCPVRPFAGGPAHRSQTVVLAGSLPAVERAAADQHFTGRQVNRFGTEVGDGLPAAGAAEVQHLVVAGFEPLQFLGALQFAAQLQGRAVELQGGALNAVLGVPRRSG